MQLALILPFYVLLAWLLLDGLLLLFFHLLQYCVFLFYAIEPAVLLVLLLTIQEKIGWYLILSVEKKQGFI